MPITEPACDRSESEREAGGDDVCLTGEVRRGVIDHAAPGQNLGQTPVHDLHFTEAADHHVGGLQVAVDDVAQVAEGFTGASSSTPPDRSGRRIEPIVAASVSSAGWVCAGEPESAGRPTFKVWVGSQKVQCPTAAVARRPSKTPRCRRSS